MSSVTLLPTFLLNLPIIRKGDISSEAPTPAPKRADFALSLSLAPAARALSLASPAPADTANPAPTKGLKAVAPRIPPKEPKASPNFEATSPN